MKRLPFTASGRFTAAALGALLAAAACFSCSKEVETPPSSIEPSQPCFHAEIADESSPTKVYVDEGLRVLWHAGDRISVFDHSTLNRPYRFEGESGDSAGDFSPLPFEGSDSGSELPGITAVYPYSSETVMNDNGVLQVILPSEQEYADNSFASGANLMVAAPEDHNLLFRNVCSYLVIQLYGEGISASEMTLSGNHSEVLAGPALVTSAPGEMPTLSLSESGPTQVSLCFPDPVPLGASKAHCRQFWFVLPPTVLSEGFTLEVKDARGHVFEKKMTREMTLERNRLYRMAPLDLYDLVEVTNYALLADTYYDRVWSAGELMEDFMHCRNATSVVRLDREQDLWPGTVGHSDVVFFDGKGGYLSTIQANVTSGISRVDYPAEAAYVAFTYYRDALIGDAFYVSTRDPSFCRPLYSTILKRRGERPEITITRSDSQEDIFKKLVDAWYTRDCDVRFENDGSSYCIDEELFDRMKSRYGWGTAYELPLGGNCRYYFQGATVTGSYDGSDADVQDNCNLFGTHRQDGAPFELHDGNLVSHIGYCIHDEASGGPLPYTHLYQNMHMSCRTLPEYGMSLAKEIGGGIGAAGVVEIDSCVFDGDTHVAPENISWHGVSDGVERHFCLTIRNSTFSKGIGLHQLSPTEWGSVSITGCQMPVYPSSSSQWSVSIQ